jgi:hypothetical protein
LLRFSLVGESMLRSAAQIALIAGMALSFATPASAFSWLCYAKDRAGNQYEDRAFGLSNDWARNRATEKALAKCEAAGGKSCKIKECVDLDAQYK